MSQADQYERYMLGLVNAERAKVGLTALKLELNLNESAEAHSEWMLAADVFSHIGQGGSSATKRMTDAGFDFSGTWRSAENIAVQSERGDAGIMDDVYNLHVSLMNSAGHRANILDPNLTYVGIGIELGDFRFSSGTYESVIVTQNFASTGGRAQLDTGLTTQTATAAPATTTQTATLAAAPTGSDGNDTVSGTAGVDRIYTGAGNDKVYARGGNDMVFGEAGNDILLGNGGNDVLRGGAGDDTLNGQSGDDRLTGDGGNDMINGGSGNDVINGAAGHDNLSGQKGNDRIIGADGNDTLKGGSGRDTLDGGRGNEQLFGGSDSDTFVFKRGGDVDRIRDFQNNVDEIDLRSFNFNSAQQALQFASQQGTDVVFNFGNGDRLIVDDIKIAQLSDDFLL